MTDMPQDRSERMPVLDVDHPERSSRSRSAQAFHFLAAALRLSIGWVFLWRSWTSCWPSALPPVVTP